MKGAFDLRDVGQSAPSQDTELTLSPTSLLLIFFALVLVCGLCFGLGYATGHRSSQDNSAALPYDSNAPSSQPDSGHAKPSGNTHAPVVTQPTASADEQGSPDSNTAGASAQSAAVAAAGGSSAESPQVKPAFGSAATPVQPATSPGTPAMATAPAAASLMVQIAAVSQPEDSDVLVSALRKRGYAVFAHREPLDGLIHVRIGPFKTADEAEKWRQKLLNDGYNAILQQ
jgi:cell division septation protein DedD